MATETGVGPFTNTLSTTVADTINFTNPWPKIEVTNHDAADLIYFRQDGTTAVAAADGCEVVLPGQKLVVKSQLNWRNGSCQVGVSIVGDGGLYTVAGSN